MRAVIGGMQTLISCIFGEQYDGEAQRYVKRAITDRRTFLVMYNVCSISMKPVKILPHAPLKMTDCSSRDLRCQNVRNGPKVDDVFVMLLMGTEPSSSILAQSS
jgi:hypothetical protein